MSMQQTLSATSLSITPISPSIGAEVAGFDFHQPLAPDTCEQINQALLDWKVLYFAAPEISTRQHLDFARNQ